MRKKDGFTLVEILISIALLTIMATFFLLLIANHFRILDQTKAITEDVFLAQRVVEEEIDSVKQEIQYINDGHTPADPRPTYTQTVFASDLGGVEVSYYETEIDYNNRHYFTLVSNIKPEPLEIIHLDSLHSDLKHHSISVDYGYGETDFSMIGEFTNSQTYKYDHLLNQVEWFVASEEFIMPMPKSDGFTYDPDFYPTFPNDYKLIDNETIYDFGTSQSTFDLLDEYRGRHIVFTATPAAKSGKLGEQLFSESMFVSGLPVSENLLLHLDASYIDISISSEVQTFSGNWYVYKWYDISSIMGQSAPTEWAQTTGLSKPVVTRTESGDAFIGQYVSFGENQELEISQTTSGQLTVFSIVKNRSMVDEVVYLGNGSNVLSLEANTEEGLELWLLKEEVITPDGNTFAIGGNYLDIAEMIIYNGTLDADQTTEIENYLVGKYVDVIVGDYEPE